MLVAKANVSSKQRQMKRKGNLYQKIISVENLYLADANARKGKKDQYGVQSFDKNKEPNIIALHELLKRQEFKTSPYTTFIIEDPKEREIFCLPYYPDRILHHAIMLELEDIFVSTFTTDTYSCIKGRGVHAALRSLQKVTKNKSESKYCLKIDIKKFYPSIDHQILKKLMRKKIKDKALLVLLDEIIDSAPGLPIGNYLSQYFANFYLTYFDHWIKEVMGVKHYFRYADDIVIPADNKEYLHQLLSDITLYLDQELKLTVKGNYQIFPVVARGIDFLGYVVFHNHTRLRKSTKKNCFRMLSRNPNKASLASYNGWMVHANCKNLQKKINDKKIGNYIFI